jgi:hypothetical protein
MRVACMRLLDRLKAPGRNAHSIGLAHSADLTLGITRRPAPLKEFEKQRVGGRVHAVVRLRAGGSPGRCYKDLRRRLAIPYQETTAAKSKTSR